MIPHGCWKAERADLTSGARLFHRACDGELRRWGASLTCSKCRGEWGPHRLESYTENDIGDRFYCRPTPLKEAFALVWATDGKKRFVKEVPAHEAANYERFKP